MRPRPARRVVAALDVVETPLDLRRRVGLPVVAEARHLLARQSLRDAERSAGGVEGLVVPAALTLPQLVQAGELVDLEAGLEHQRAPRLAAARVLVARARHVAGVGHRTAAGGTGA